MSIADPERSQNFTFVTYADSLGGPRTDGLEPLVYSLLLLQARICSQMTLHIFDMYDFICALRNIFMRGDLKTNPPFKFEKGNPLYEFCRQIF